MNARMMTIERARIGSQTADPAHRGGASPRRAGGRLFGTRNCRRAPAGTCHPRIRADVGNKAPGRGQRAGSSQPKGSGPLSVGSTTAVAWRRGSWLPHSHTPLLSAAPQRKEVWERGRKVTAGRHGGRGSGMGPLSKDLEGIGSPVGYAHRGWCSIFRVKEDLCLYKEVQHEFANQSQHPGAE